MMVSWSLRLQLSILLVGLCQARNVRPPSTSQGKGEVPMSQLKMLSMGLARLLQEVEENTGRLERQGEQVAAELDDANRSLESLRKQSLQAGRTHRQVRRNHSLLRNSAFKFSSRVKKYNV